MRYAEVEKALAYAMEHHAGQVRKGNPVPYVTHPIILAMLARDFRDPLPPFLDETTLVVSAITHDLPEDTDVTIGDIKRLFGQKVADIVDLLTRRDGQRYFDYISRIIDSGNEYAIIIKYCDTSHNSKCDPQSTMNKRYVKSLRLLSEAMENLGIEVREYENR